MRLHTLTSETADPRERGAELGTRFGALVRDTSARYLAHFELLGIPLSRVREIVEGSRAALREWHPALAEESDAAAAAAGIEPWHAAAVGARTEVLAATHAPGECTTAVLVPPAGAPETIQTWDWHDHLAPDGLLWALHTAERQVKVFTEFGAPAKIGVSDAGLGVHFNILRHASDGAGAGVPVHAIARRVLEEASTVAEAHEIAASAPVSASTVLTVATWDGAHADAAAIELSPAGVGVVRPGDDGWIVHTNHFLDPGLAAGDMIAALDPTSTTLERFAHAESARSGMPGLGARERAAALCGAAGESAPVCVRRNESEPLHEQWETLLTIALDLPGFALEHRPGAPDLAGRSGLTRF
ncbi:MAG TPA: C45 family peptidase [Microbacterium sp.]|nr:C45 family peptidase [Microbacterium sp.]